MRIQFDPTNLRAEMVGAEHGLTSEDLSGANGEALAALDGLRRGYEAGHYGFPDLPNDAALVKSILQFAKSVAGTYDTVCVIGIGGSSLGGWALDCGMRGPHPIQGAYTPKRPRLVVLDNVDPDFTHAALASMNPKKTLLVPIAKSGSTAETVATFLIVREWLTKAMGRRAHSRIAVVTTKGKGELDQMATAEKYQAFYLPESVGGRFSVLSAVGLVPAALIGLDIRKLLKGAAAITISAWKTDLASNTALQAALYHWMIWTRRKKSIQVAFPYSNKLWGTAFWFRQLWAESLGKAKSRKGQTVHVGQTPVAALGTTDQHSQVQLYMEGPNDKVYSFWAVGRFANQGRIPRGKTGFESMDYLAGQTLEKLIDSERRATAAALTENGRPNCTYTLDKVDAEHLGAFLMMMEFQTAFMGELLDINAFDQEGVELGKKFTFALMGRKGYDEYANRFKAYEAKRKVAK